MESFPVFLSLIYVVRNEGEHLESLLKNAVQRLSGLISDYEIIVVDNGSNDDSVEKLRKMTLADGLPNLQVFALIKEVDEDTASWVGLENALGDFVAILDPLTDDIGFLPSMLEKSMSGADVVFASNNHKSGQSIAYRAASIIFDRIYKSFNGIKLVREAPRYRILSKRVVNFILQHRQPALTYRHLPATGGFNRVKMDYSAEPLALRKKKLGDSIDRGMRILVSTTRAPMRLVTALSMFGAISNLLYSVFVVIIALFKRDIEPGWASLSLQQSGMFFLLSLVLLVLGEYILQMASLSNEGPQYHIGQEFTSARMSRRERLNIEETGGNLSRSTVAL